MSVVDHIPTWYATTMEPCEDVASVQVMVNERQAMVTRFFTHPDWQAKLEKNIADHSHDFDGFYGQMMDHWYAEEYFEAGKAFGLIEAYLFGIL